MLVALLLVGLKDSLQRWRYKMQCYCLLRFKATRWDNAESRRLNSRERAHLCPRMVDYFLQSSSDRNFCMHFQITSGIKRHRFFCYSIFCAHCPRIHRQHHENLKNQEQSKIHHFSIIVIVLASLSCHPSLDANVLHWYCLGELIPINVLPSQRTKQNTVRTSQQLRLRL